MNPLIEQFVSSKRIAVVGMSRSGKKFGNMAAKELKAKGYEIYPVHPEAVEIDGFTCSPNLQSLTGKIDGVWISIPPKNVSPVLEDAAQMGLKNIWLQQGAWSAEVQQTIDQLQFASGYQKVYHDVRPASEIRASVSPHHQRHFRQVVICP